MRENMSDLTHNDTQIGVRSPFSLTKDTKLKLISLPSNLNSQNGSGLSPTSSTTSSTDTSEIMSPKNLISSNPFSLNVKKLGSMGLTSSSALTSTSLQTPSISTSISKDNLSQDQKIVELQKEISSLKKDIEAKDAKLSSSVKSIKQFWSPELKKERAARKEEVERSIILKEKCQSGNTQIEEYKNALEDLESELNSQQQQIKLLSEQLKLANQNKVLNSSVEEELIHLRDESKQQDDEIFVLNRTIDDFEIKYTQLEEECFEKNKCISDLEIILVDHEHKEKEYEADKNELELLYKTLSDKEHEFTQLQEELKQVHETLAACEKKYLKQQKLTDGLYATVKEKERRITSYKRQLAEFEHKAEDLKTQCEESEKYEKQIESYEEQVTAKNEHITKLENTLRKQDRLYESTKYDIGKMRKKDEENTERINELEDLFLAKDKEHDKLKGELKSTQEQLTVAENKIKTVSKECDLKNTAEIIRLKDIIESKEKEISVLQKKSLQIRVKLQDAEQFIREKEYQLDELRASNLNSQTEEIIESKGKEIKDLSTKYEKLDKYLSEREVALENCREELSELKQLNNSFNNQREQLMNQVFEQKTLIERLEKQKERFKSKREEDAVSLVMYNEPKNKLERVNENKDNLQKLCKEKQNNIENIEKQLDEERETVKSLKASMEADSNKIKEFELELKKLKTANTELSKDNESSKLKIANLEKQRNRATSDDSPLSPTSKSTKQFWDELSKKESRIEELEKQMKEKNRQLALIKKNQNTERGKQHELVSNTKKVEEELSSQLKQLQEEKEKKEKRILMLEDALRESVSIAAEREDLLAQHVEISEETGKKLSDSESEFDRVVIEKAITNIKNAFLILSLSERDALIASMKATRRRHIEELSDIKHESLLQSISEKDTQIAHLELTQLKQKRQEIKQMKLEKERFVAELKEQNNARMLMINNQENNDNLIINELKDAPPEQVYEAIRHLASSTGKLEYYIEELMSYLRERNVELLKNMPSMPKKRARSIEKVKKASKDELMKELRFVDTDSIQLKKYVDTLLDKLEG